MAAQLQYVTLGDAGNLARTSPDQSAHDGVAYGAEHICLLNGLIHEGAAAVF